MKLDLSTEKTLITHARTHKARFLGYDIWTRQADNWHTKGKRSLNGSIVTIQVTRRSGASMGRRGARCAVL
jgi:hypothetical protein